MLVDRLQAQRFELKFRISPIQVAPLREFLRCYLEHDEFSSTSPDHSYPVHSLYLDSPFLDLCRATLTGQKNRHKLRIRYYDTEFDTPAFLEIKRRQNDCILKQRTAVHKDVVAALLLGKEPADYSHLYDPSSRNLAALRFFMEQVHAIHARPQAHVGYSREAWTSPIGNSVRVTFDHDIRYQRENFPVLNTLFQDPIQVFGRAVILELKFVDRFPGWLSEMVQQFGLTRGSAAKYAQGEINAASCRSVLTRDLQNVACVNFE